MKELIEKAKKIRCVICDVDGVLTDGLLYIDNHGNEQKAFNIQDGMGLKLLMAAGIEVAVITTSRNAVIDHRMQQLGIRHYFKGQVDKRAAYDQLKIQLELNDEDFAYKEFAAWHTQMHGGRGAVREACDFILNAQNKQEEALNRYLLS